MNYYGPRERKSDGRFDYTCQNDDRVWPVGYCVAPRVWTPDDFKYLWSGLEEQQREADKLNARYGPLAANFHANGHATKDEACACYRKYLLDTELRFVGPNPDVQKPCAAKKPDGSPCGQWTQHEAEVSASNWPLCEAHQTRAVVETLFPEVGTIFSS